jgi:hypothetical protein
MKSSEAENWYNFKRLKKLRSYTEFQLLRQLKLRCYSDLKFWKTGRPGAPQYSFLNYRAIPKTVAWALVLIQAVALALAAGLWPCVWDRHGVRVKARGAPFGQFSKSSCPHQICPIEERYGPIVGK